MRKAIIVVAAIALLLFGSLLAKVDAQTEAPTVAQATVAQATSATAATKPARIIFFHIDGLHYEAPKRLGMANYLALEQQGTSVREAYIILPWHQTENGYRDLSLTSPPNPTTMAGTLFLDPWWQERYIQHAFYPVGLTAHIANSTAYASLNPGMHFVKLNRGKDEDNIR